MRTAPVTCGSRLFGTDYIFTNLGGRYRVYPLPAADTCVASFTRWDDMWAWVKANPNVKEV